MITLTTEYAELSRSQTYAFSDLGKVCVCLYARVAEQDKDTLCSKVAVKLTRIITGRSSGVGYSYISAQATLSGSLSHSWSGGGSGMVYVGEHTVFEETFTVYHADDGSMSLSLAAVYDDSYIAARSVDTVICALPPIEVAKPTVPAVKEVYWDTVQPTRHSQVTLYWDCDNADYYHVSICRLYVPGDPAQDGVVVYEADVYEKGVTFGLASLPLAAGDDLYFMLQAHNSAGGSGNGFSSFYRLRPTLWINAGGWRRGVPWVQTDGVWQMANGMYLRVQEDWRTVT